LDLNRPATVYGLGMDAADLFSDEERGAGSVTAPGAAQLRNRLAVARRTAGNVRHSKRRREREAAPSDGSHAERGA